MSMSADTSITANTPMDANTWYQGTVSFHQQVDKNIYLYGSESISKVMSKEPDGLGVAEYAGRFFKNLEDALHVKFARLVHKLFTREWVNNKTIRVELENKINELNILVNKGKANSLSEADQNFVDLGISEMKKVLAVIEARKVKGVDVKAISEQLNDLNSSIKRASVSPGAPLNQPQIEQTLLTASTEQSAAKKLTRDNIDTCDDFGLEIPEKVIDQLLNYINGCIKNKNHITRIVVYRASGRAQPGRLIPKLEKSPSNQTALIFLYHQKTQDFWACDPTIAEKCKTFCHLTFWGQDFHTPTHNLDTFFKAFDTPDASLAEANQVNLGSLDKRNVGNLNSSIQKSSVNPESSPSPPPIEQLGKSILVAASPELSVEKKLTRDNIDICEFGISIPDVVIDQLLNYVNGGIAKELEKKVKENNLVKYTNNITRIVVYRAAGRVQADLLVSKLEKSPPNQTALICLYHQKVKDFWTYDTKVTEKCQTLCHLTFWMDDFHIPTHSDIPTHNLDVFFKAFITPEAPSASLS